MPKSSSLAAPDIPHLPEKDPCRPRRQRGLLALGVFGVVLASIFLWPNWVVAVSHYLVGHSMPAPRIVPPNGLWEVDDLPEPVVQVDEEALKNIALPDLGGKLVHLKDHLGRKPIVIEFGSFT